MSAAQAPATNSSANGSAVGSLRLHEYARITHKRNYINTSVCFRQYEAGITSPTLADGPSGQSAMRQGERERRAGALLALHGQIPAHRLGEIAADRQAEARSLFGVGQTASDLHERGEDRLEVGGLDADAGIGDMQGDRLAAVLPRHLDAAAGGRELDRVRQEVNENLLYLRPIRAHRQIERVLAAMKRQLSLAKLRLDHRN